MSSRDQAILSAPSIAALAHRALLDAFLKRLTVDDALYEDAWRVRTAGIERARLDQLFDFRDRDPRCGRHDRVKVAGRLAIEEVALPVGLPGMNDRKIRGEAALHYIGLAIEFAGFLPFRHQRADPRFGEKGRDPGAASADALRQGALRIEFELELAFKVELLEELVFADIGRDHLADLPALEQQTKAGAINPGIIGNDGQSGDAGIADRGD